jgi:hypothetical protein
MFKLKKLHRWKAEEERRLSNLYIVKLLPKQVETLQITNSIDKYFILKGKCMTSLWARWDKYLQYIQEKQNLPT